MSPWRGAVNEWLQRHHGVIPISVMAEAGCSERTSRRLVERGEFVVALPGILRSAHWPQGPEQHMVAASLRNPGVVVGFVTAARLWNLRRMPRTPAVHLLVAHRHKLVIGEPYVVHRCRSIDAADVVMRADGIRVTSPARTLFDCADMVGEPVTASALEQVIDQGLGTFATHVATFNRLAHARRPGTRTMRAVLRSRPAWREAVQSDLEMRVLHEIARHGVTQPVTQFSLRTRGGTFRLDFAWPAERVALEVDHPFWHAGAEESRRDKSRDRKLAASGWTVLRITDLDVHGGLVDCLTDLATVLRRQRPA
jgi:very-short-patch-repair endonuclease